MGSDELPVETSDDGGDTVQPREDTVQPREDAVQPREDAVQPRGSMNRPREDTGRPREDTGQPREDDWRREVERLERRGLAALERGDYQSAFKILYDALSICEDHGDEARYLSVAAYAGVALYEKGDRSRAVSVWEELLQRGWRAATIVGLLLEHYEERELLEDAQRIRKQFSEASPPEIESLVEAAGPQTSGDDAGATRILVADDDEDIRALLRRHLEKNGYSVRVAADGETALQQIFHWQPDVVLLDVYMPHYSGLDVLYRMREEGLDTAAIVISGMADASLIEGIPALRAAFLRKPLDMAELRRTIESLVEKRGAKRA